MGNGGSGQQWSGYATDLHNLYKAGRRDLPSIAAAYAEANDSLSKVLVEKALQGAEPFGGTTTLVQFLQLRDDLQALLGNASVALNETGEALCLAAETYAGTDAEIVKEMKLVGTDLPQVPQPIFPTTLGPRRAYPAGFGPR